MGSTDFDFYAFLFGYYGENIRFVRSDGPKTTFEWPKVTEVSFPSFLGVIRSIKVVSVFRFGDRKCRFRDIAIRTFLRQNARIAISRKRHFRHFQYLLIVGENMARLLISGYFFTIKSVPAQFALRSTKPKSNLFLPRQKNGAKILRSLF